MAGLKARGCVSGSWPSVIVVKGWMSAGGVAGFGMGTWTPGDGLAVPEERGPLVGL